MGYGLDLLHRIFVHAVNRIDCAQFTRHLQAFFDYVDGNDFRSQSTSNHDPSSSHWPKAVDYNGISGADIQSLLGMVEGSHRIC
ncbi:hypothetical protein D3C81_1648190 [compost metagenome]